MKNDLIAYRDQLQAKLDAVNAVIADIAGSAPKTLKRNGRRKTRGKGKRKMSAAAKKALSLAAKARWKKVKAAGKRHL